MFHRLESRILATFIAAGSATMLRRGMLRRKNLKTLSSPADSAQPELPQSSGPAAGVPLVGNPIKGYGQFPLGLVAPDFGNVGYADLPVARREDLPDQVLFRSNAEGFNQKIEVALRGGELFVRNIGDTTWRCVPTPESLSGNIHGISINEDALVAVDTAGWMYTLSNLLSSPSRWGWIRAWGSPFWFGRGQQSPNTSPGKWSLSLIGNHTDRFYETSDGKRQPISLAKVTQVLALSPDGSRIYSLDPWLARDYSYEVGTPLNGRFQVHSLSASGSQIFVMNRYGDMFTRLDDFDIKGADPAQFRYTWGFDPRPAAAGALSHRLNPTTAPIALPSDDWHQQPKIPGAITDRISIHSTAQGSKQRELRVEGQHKGLNGYWHKQLFDAHWSFTPTGLPLEGHRLENPSEDSSTRTLAAPSPFAYRGELSNGVMLSVEEFSYASPKREVLIHTGKRHYPLVLHTIDGRLGSPLSMRMSPVKGQFGPRPAGLVESTPRNYAAAFELPKSTQRAAHSDPVLARFLAQYFKGQQFRPVYLKVTPARMRVLHSPILGIALALPRSVVDLHAVASKSSTRRGTLTA
ncbi:hypothetical protein [Corynebacterium gerontici]|uniref:Uncharacterized protein n=1 Tax=Corynebacterium gerontici TaxID=2079234 RepID=A0A3G6IZP3_9CORY|nr:hypothetical protein [Corynebacterium gerontici]AZA10983.1 hypothetical protein CGERO_03315 [Corynebacterium gerontici]